MDEIQRTLIKAGRKDLAQKYYHKIIAASLPSSIKDKLYSTRVKFRGYNTQPSVETAHGKDAGDILIMLRPDITKAQHAQLSKKFLDLSNKMNKQWDKVINQAAQATWGRDWQVSDYRVSGIGSSEFDEKYKKKLRELAHGSSKAKAISDAHKYASKSRKITAGKKYVVYKFKK